MTKKTVLSPAKAWRAKMEKYEAAVRLDRRARWHVAGEIVTGVALRMGLKGIYCRYEDAPSKAFGLIGGRAWWDSREAVEYMEEHLLDAAPDALAPIRQRVADHIRLHVAGAAGEMVQHGGWDERWITTDDLQYDGAEAAAYANLLSPEVKAEDLIQQVVIPECRRIYDWLAPHRQHLEVIAEALSEDWDLTGEQVTAILAGLPPIRRRWNRARAVPASAAA